MCYDILLNFKNSHCFLYIKRMKIEIIFTFLRHYLVNLLDVFGIRYIP